jgi:hypothetical protein
MVLRVLIALEERSFGSSAWGGLRTPVPARRTRKASLAGSAILLRLEISLVICFLRVDSKVDLVNVAVSPLRQSSGGRTNRAQGWRAGFFFALVEGTEWQVGATGGV